MRKAFLAVALMSAISGCAVPSQPTVTQSTTWLVVYKYASSDSSGLEESRKAAEIHCSEYGKKAELDGVQSLNIFTSVATFRCGT